MGNKVKSLMLIILLLVFIGAVFIYARAVETRWIHPDDPAALSVGVLALWLFGLVLASLALLKLFHKDTRADDDQNEGKSS
jgi:hypothetical protein